MLFSLFEMKHRRKKGKHFNNLTLRLSHSESLRSNKNEETLLRRQSQFTDLDINKEKRTQKFLLLILISHFICIVPINILKYV